MKKPSKHSLMVDLVGKVAFARDTSFGNLVKIGRLNPRIDFRAADLSNVDFGNLDVSRFDFTNSDLSGADLSKVRNFELAIFVGANFANAKVPYDAADELTKAVTDLGHEFCGTVLEGILVRNSVLKLSGRWDEPTMAELPLANVPSIHPELGEELRFPNPKLTIVTPPTISWYASKQWPLQPTSSQWHAIHISFPLGTHTDTRFPAFIRDLNHRRMKFGKRERGVRNVLDVEIGICPLSAHDMKHPCWRAVEELRKLLDRRRPGGPTAAMLARRFKATIDIGINRLTERYGIPPDHVRLAQSGSRWTKSLVNWDV